ncbi:MAG: hypothetical protein ACTSR8_18730 [Promethearchaeota archaeon]
MQQPKKKKPKLKSKVDIRKKRKKLIQKQQKEFGKKDVVPEKKKQKSEKEEKLEIRLKKETKLYWMRALTGALSAFIGRLFFGLVGWWLLFWMIAFWFGFPFISSFFIFRFEYDKEEWSWKNILKPGIGIFFFLFMIVGVFIHTLLLFS